LDKFPEAFKRFEDHVDVGKFETYHQLTLAFRWWAGERWRGTHRQWSALNREAEHLGFYVPNVYRESIREKWSSDYGERRTWRRENVNLRGKTRNVYRDIRTGRFVRKP
jgi:predicted glycosyltransferase involved in capsule biosynthesis